MTVAENLFLGHEPLRWQSGGTGLVDHDRIYIRLVAALPLPVTARWVLQPALR
jgi:ABC-type sugar transport system ATPase subunit